MKLALHRSIIFWSGWLIMAFACWAWRDSYFLNRYASRGGYGFSHMNGGIALARITHYLGSTRGSMPPSKSWRLETFPPPLFIRSGTPGPPPEKPGEIVLHEPFSVKESWTYAAKHEVGSIRIFIPYWLVLLATALLWLTLLIWRGRRRARLHAAAVHV